MNFVSKFESWKKDGDEFSIQESDEFLEEFEDSLLFAVDADFCNPN